MQFKDILGYSSAKKELLSLAHSGKIPHNILLDQLDGMPGVPLAWAWFQYLNCEHPQEDDSCGTCRHCKMIAELAYPDLYFIYPVVGAAGSEDPSGDFFSKWQEMLLAKRAYFSSEDWLEALKADNSRPVIYSGDALSIERKLSLHISESGYRMVIIYQPERMREEMANKLLKLMEEPPEKTLFVSVSLDPDRLLETILSRMQRLEIGTLTHEEMEHALLEYDHSLSKNDCYIATERAEGILYKAINTLQNSQQNLSYTKDYNFVIKYIESKEVGKLKALSEEMAKKGREYVVASLEYLLANLRFALRCGIDASFPRETMNRPEQQIEQYIRGWVHSGNILPLYDAIEQAIAHIKGNVVSKIVLFDLFMQLSVILTPSIKEASLTKIKARQKENK